MRPRDHFSAISHLVGAIFAAIAAIVLIWSAATKAEPWKVVGFSIFGASLVLLYTASALYHLAHASSRSKRVFQLMDHILIYVLIAGTFTPLCLTVLRGPWGWTMLGVIWAFAAFGIIGKSVWEIPGWVSTLFYIAMGWLGVVVIVPLYQALPLPALFWFFGGGIAYTVGAGFFGLDDRYPSHRWFNLHDLFHLFVLAGSACHVVVMFYLL